MDKTVILGFIRHVLTFGGGSLVAAGTVDETMMLEAVGALVTLIGVAWSVWDKKRVSANG